MNRLAAFFFLIALVASTSYAHIANRGVCSRNGEICLINVETGEYTSLTSGHNDMKPSWSMENDQIVFFRVTKMTDRVQTWKTAICIVNADGSNFTQLTSGEYTDYNPTWTRNGKHEILYSRYFSTRGRSVIHRIRFSGETIEDEIISDPKQKEYALSTLKDGRILITSNRSIFTSIHWLLTPATSDTEAVYEPVNFNFKFRSIMDRATFSPDETNIAFEYKAGYGSFSYEDKQITIADFDRQSITISNSKRISPRARQAMTLYPRWLADGKSLVYHSNREGPARLYHYNLETEQTTTVPGDRKIPYEFFCGERSPK